MVRAGCGLRQSSGWRHIIPSSYGEVKPQMGLEVEASGNLTKGGFKKYTSINESWGEVQGAPQRELTLAPP